ncbi:putative cytosine deaminase [Mollisia scopiformis]|uniref:Cytosine deaminase n=1 Tax=Mollisia scopiformis TaxID=149040 RepID=A0A194XQ13_MOLSC|nr:putative cytosine deaminase [Mollisia scopiformis]KUJ22251.1 putative cytosine deaminase [Mollisia scopiformis]
MNDQEAFAIAVEEAKLGYKEGGVPIGAALISRDGKLLGRGHNMRVQKGSAIHHGETAALENSGRLPASAYKGATMYTTLSPCDMWYVLLLCLLTGACILYGISRVVIGENKTYLGGEAYLKQRGIEVVVMENEECRDLMELFIKEKPEIWNEDIGEEARVYSKSK